MNHSFEITLFLLLEASGEEEREKEINVVASETRLPIDRYTRTFCTLFLPHNRSGSINQSKLHHCGKTIGIGSPWKIEHRWSLIGTIHMSSSCIPLNPLICNSQFLIWQLSCGTKCTSYTIAVKFKISTYSYTWVAQKNILSLWNSYTS